VRGESEKMKAYHQYLYSPSNGRETTKAAMKKKQ